MKRPYKALCATGVWLTMVLAQANVWAQGPPAAVNPQPAPDARELAPGLPVEREIAGGEIHSYRLTLTEGQYLHALVKGQDIALSVRLSEPGGELVGERNRNHKMRPEVMLALARRSGEYRLTVSAPGQKGLSGSYTIRVEELRSAQPEDQDRVAAERAFAEGERLLTGENTAQSYRAALGKFEEALAGRQATGDRQGEAEALAFIGVAYRRLGDYRKALEYYHRALPLFRTAGDRLGEGETLNNMGAAHISKGEFEEALGVLNQALPLQREVGDRQGEISTLHNLGSVYLARGEALSSLDYFQQTLPLRRALRDRAGEARTLNNIGLAYADLSEPQKALESQMQALPLRREAGDRSGEANTIGNIGLIYLDLGEPEKALDYNERALSLRQAIGVPRDLAVSHRNMSLTYSALGDERRALDHGERALSIFRELGHRQGEASMLNQLGSIHDRLGDHQQALDYYGRALSLYRTTGDRRGEAQALDGLGRSHAARREWEKALDHYRRALALYGAVRFSTGEAQTLLGLARVERERGDLGEARRRIEAALEVIESVRARIAVGQLRASYLATTREFYEFHIDILMAMHRRQPSQGFDAEALRASERARARSLLDSLLEARANIRQGVEQSLLEREHNLRQQLNAKEVHRLRLLEDKQAEERVSAAERDLQDLLTQLEHLQAQIRVQSPRYAALTQPAPIKLEEIQQQVLDDETLLLEYALGTDRSFLWAVTRSTTSSFLLPGREKIERAARRAYELMRVSHRRQNRREAELAAEELSRMLLGPVADRLGKQRLLVVADGMLQYIPFAALPVPARQGERPAAVAAPRAGTHTYVPLVVEHEVVSAPSASALAVLRRELAHRKPAPKMVAVLADPVLQSGDGRVARNRPGSGREGAGPALASRPPTGAEDGLLRGAREAGILSFERLPFSRHEAEAILALSRNTGDFKALDFDANRTTATSPELADYKIVHFATHGLINSQHPELSGVVLSLVDEQGRPQDGFLRLHDIYNLKLGADLVVLSACQTALGKQVRGEGLVGLVQGFTYAGAAQVVASLWDVKDEATAELMKRFYQKMIVENQKPGAALRAAQVLMWKEERWREPYYWAGFTLQGEWK